jgi:hypothetical protein
VVSGLPVTGFFLFFAPDDETVDDSSGAASFLWTLRGDEDGR